MTIHDDEKRRASSRIDGQDNHAPDDAPYDVPADEAGRLAALDALGLLDTEPERGFDDLVQLARDVCGTSMAAISLVAGDRQWFKARVGFDVAETPRDESFCTHAILGRQVMEVPDATEDVRFEDNPLVTGPMGLRFYASAPLWTRGGHALGTLAVLDTEPRSLSSDQRRQLQALAAQVVDQIERRQAIADLRVSEKRFRRLIEHTGEVSAVVGETGEILFVSERVDELIGRPAEDILGATAFKFVHADDLARSVELLGSAVENPGVPKRGRFRVRHANGSWRHLELVVTSYLDDPDLRGVMANVKDVTDSVSMARALATSGQTFSLLVEHSSDIIVVLDEELRMTFASSVIRRLLGFTVDEVVGRSALDFVEPEHHARVGAVLTRATAQDEPESIELRLRCADGSVRWFEARGLDLTDDTIIEGFLVNLRDIDDRKQFEEQLDRTALIDQLTGLANRALLENRVEYALEKCRRTTDSCALVFVDLDRFKLVNESAGRAAGDQVLREVAERISGAVDPAHTVARLAADEFAVLCQAVDDIDDAVAVAAAVHEQLGRSFKIGERELTVSASVGIAIASAETSSTELLQAADTALHVAKERGRGRTEVFEQALREQVIDKLDLLSGLQRALADKALTVVFQPVVRLSDARIVGAEALVRWTHETRGPVPAAEFISLAEEGGLIGRLGDQVLRQVAPLATRWASHDSGFAVSVNVSPLQLVDPAFGKRFLDVLERCGAPTQAIVIEVTESAGLARTGPTRDNLDVLAAAGVRLAIDDFGTGYSSLSTLQDIGADVVKIDGSFISGLIADDARPTIVKAIIDLGHAVGMRVVAEHVETEEQASILRELGCDLAQGYLFSRPTGAEKIDRHLR